MAHDDMYVVMYKVMAYIYGRMKKGVEPDPEMYSADALGVPQGYWTCVMKELVDHGYVAGMAVMSTPYGFVVDPKRPRVTMEGVAFLEENSMMGKAKAFLKEAKDVIAPFI